MSKAYGGNYIFQQNVATSTTPTRRTSIPAPPAPRPPPMVSTSSMSVASSRYGRASPR